VKAYKKNSAIYRATLYNTHMRWLTSFHVERRDVIGWFVVGRGISTAECSSTAVIGRGEQHVTNYKSRDKKCYWECWMILCCIHSYY